MCLKSNYNKQYVCYYYLTNKMVITSAKNVATKSATLCHGKKLKTTKIGITSAIK